MELVSKTRENPRRNVVIWDTIAEKEDKRTIQGTIAQKLKEWLGEQRSLTPTTLEKHNRKSESGVFFRIETISRTQKPVAGNDTDKGSGTFSSEVAGTIRNMRGNIAQTQSGGSGEANHNLHLPQVPGRVEQLAVVRSAGFQNSKHTLLSGREE